MEMGINYKEQFDRDGYVVIDDIINVFNQEEIKSLLFNPNFPYFFVPDIIWGKGIDDEDLNGEKKYPGLYHLFVLDGNINSDLFIQPIQNMIFKGSEIVESEHRELTFSRMFLTLPLHEQFKGTDKKLHIDRVEPHLVVLYYVIDSDGDTLLTNIMGNGEEIDYEKYLTDESNIKVKVTPKQGRALIFNGLHYHGVTPPKNGVRSIINSVLI
jgi:hypothetical protein